VKSVKDIEIFETFAKATFDKAKALYGEPVANSVKKAWIDVGVLKQ